MELQRVGGPRRVEVDDVERTGAEPVGEVVDGADRGIGEAELSGDDALCGDRHSNHVGVRSEQADLRRGLEAGADRLPVDAAVAQRAGSGWPGGDDLRAPGTVEAGRAVGALVAEDREAEVKGDEVVRADQAADRQLLAERADRADRQDAIAALLDQRPEVCLVIDLVWQSVGTGAVTLDDRGAVLGCRGSHGLPAGAEGAAAEHHREPSHRPILRLRIAYGEGVADRPSGREESESERLDRNLSELLQELRVALPGVQVLFAFLLAVPFQQNFTKITPFQEKVYFATLLLTAVSAIVLICDVLYGPVTTAVTGTLALLAFAFFWYLLPLRRRFSSEAEPDRPR